MKGRGASFLLRALGLLVLVSVILAMVGCGGGGDGGGNKDAIALMKKLPQGSETFMFVDMKTMRDDKDLAQVYSSFDDEEGMASAMGGISMDDVDSFVMAGEMVVLMQGQFDLEEVRTQMEEDGADKDEYQGVEVWKTFGFAWALVDSNLVIMASDDDAEDCIDVIKGNSKSLYEEADVSADMGKLPGDSLVVAWGVGGENFFANETYSGLEATAISMSKKDSDTMKVTAFMRFQDSASARDAMDDVQEDMEQEGEAEVTNLKVTQDGAYVKATAETDLDEGLFS